MTKKEGFAKIYHDNLYKKTKLVLSTFIIFSCTFLGADMPGTFSDIKSEVSPEDFESAQAILEDLLRMHNNKFHKALISIPGTEEFSDVIFPRTDVVTAGKLYRMLEVLDQVLTRHHIPYWIDGGILLGAVRHQGLIPWDDDGDIEVLASDWDKIVSLEEEFQELGYEFRGYTRLWPINQVFPFVDIVLTVPKGDKIVLLHSPEVWPDNWFYQSELFPGQKLKFGPLFLRAPSNPVRYLKKHYGDDCLEYAICWQHQNNGFSSPFKVKITDFKPAPYVLD